MSARRVAVRFQVSFERSGVNYEHDRNWISVGTSGFSSDETGGRMIEFDLAVVNPQDSQETDHGYLPSGHNVDTM